MLTSAAVHGQDPWSAGLSRTTESASPGRRPHGAHAWRCDRRSEVPFLLAVLHRGFGGFVVGAGAAFGDAGGGDFGDDVVDGGGG